MKERFRALLLDLAGELNASFDLEGTDGRKRSLGKPALVALVCCELEAKFHECFVQPGDVRVSKASIKITAL
jgi:hypothetical protein